MKKKGFTLIELLAVLVVLAILALIAIPIVVSIINNARENSYKRSIEAYGKAVENAVGRYLLDNEVDYSKLGLGYDNNNSYITPVNNDKVYVEYSGETVNCYTLLVSSSGLITLKGCTVGNSDKLYKYNNKQVILEKQEYSIGDLISVNGMEFYVIEASDKNQKYVVALKAEPLTVAEINLYGGSGTENNHINKYTRWSIGTAYNWHNNGYGGMTCYSSETCGYINDSINYSSCASSYDESDVKYAVDAWTDDKFKNNELKEVDNYTARLIKYSELTNNLQCSSNDCSNSPYSWVYSNKYEYWTMSNAGTDYRVPWNVSNYGTVNNYYGDYGLSLTVRPVINVYKSVIESSD